MVKVVVAQIQGLFHNYVFWSALISWFVSQLLKSIIAFCIAPEKKLLNFVLKFGSTGGLPSSHSAVVVALGLSLGIKHGFDSDIFILAFFMASIVIRDAVGVRLSNGIQAKTLNKLGNEVSEKLGTDFTPVREINGHTKFEVFVGTMIGFVTTIIFTAILR